ncbi:MAG: peptidase associated/transthyretin-like domain-containing protein, partial [Planctomycetota bacterium]
MGRLRGRLVDNLADPIVGAEVMLQSAQVRAQLLVPATGDRPPHAHTDMAGRFTLDHPPGARLLLVVHHPYLQSQLLRRDLRLVAGRTLDLGDMELASAPGLVVAVR